MFIVTNPEEQKTKGPIGFRLRHKTATWGMVLVPLMHKPYPTPSQCPSCKVLHPVKTVHLNLEPDGSVLVSQGVLKDLRTAGLDENDLVYVESVSNPPALNIAQGKSRAEIDYYNRAMNGLGSLKGVKNG